MRTAALSGLESSTVVSTAGSAAKETAAGATRNVRPTATSSRAGSLWWNPGERRGRRGPVLPVGARLTRRVREAYGVYSDRNATMSDAQRRGEQPVVEPALAPRPVRRPADKAREGGAPTGRTGPSVFRPKRNDERREATRFSRDGSPAERRVGFITGCLAGMDRQPSPHRENWAAWVSSHAAWITPRLP